MVFVDVVVINLNVFAGKAQHHVEDGGRVSRHVQQADEVSRDVRSEAQQCEVSARQVLTCLANNVALLLLAVYANF